MRIREAFATSYRETKEQLKTHGIDLRVWRGLLVLCSLFSGAFFIYQDFGKVNPIISFVAGCISLLLLFFVIVGSFFGGLFLALATVSMFIEEKKKKKTISDGKAAIGVALMAFYWALLGTLGFLILLRIPIIGHQLGYLIRD